MSITLQQAGAQSATFLVANDDLYEEAIGIPKWELLPPGQLRDLLTRKYLTPEGEPDVAAFITAMQNTPAWSQATELKDAGMPGYFWSVSTGDYPLVPPDIRPQYGPKGYPFIKVTFFPNYGFALRIVSPYSASE